MKRSSIMREFERKHDAYNVHLLKLFGLETYDQVWTFGFKVVSLTLLIQTLS